MQDRTDWKARCAAVVAADDEEWERLSDALTADWKAAYCAAFREAAKARGWKQEDIESGWLDTMPDEAYLEVGCSGACPSTQAGKDVIACEWEAANVE